MTNIIYLAKYHAARLSRPTKNIPVVKKRKKNAADRITIYHMREYLFLQILQNPTL